MQKIEKEVRKAVKEASHGRDMQRVSSMEKSLQQFKEMVRDGYAQPRGYTLQTIDSCAHNSSVGFNVL